MTTDDHALSSVQQVVVPRREDCAIETMRCDKCNCLLASIERDEARDTGFQECRDCSMERHNDQHSGPAERHHSKP